MAGEFELPNDLQTRLNMIIRAVTLFWEQGPHSHFTLHGPKHSERVHKEKLAQLASQLPADNLLTKDEIFIVSAAAWLYEIGMQCTNLKPTVDITWRPGTSLTLAQLQQIRAHKHELTYRMIMDSVRHGYDGPRPQLGLLPDDEYTLAIAEVCRGCSNEPIDQVKETRPVNGVMVHVSLLAALLRLADQLYIDQSRINIDLLQAADLPPREKARWWAYHYASTLPIDKQGRIQFHYLLPEVHKPLFNHIRTLLEPDFRHTSNEVINYLLDKHNLRLIPHNEAQVNFDIPSGFRREMSQEMEMFLRHHLEVDPVIQIARPTSTEPAKEQGRERSLLVLDYENFILQLGLEGYFPALDNISRMVNTLFREAREQYKYVGLVDGLAVGHWQRPDLLPVANMFSETGIYTLLAVEDQQKSADKLLNELHERLQSGSLPKQVILVAPHKKLVSITRSFDERGQAFSAWLGDTPDADAYHALTSQLKSLVEVLKLPNVQKIAPEAQEITQAACILRLEDRMRADKNGISFPEASTVLKQIRAVRGTVDWWLLYVIQEEILKLLHVNNGYVLQLNTAHPKINHVNKRRDAIIGALLFLAPEGSGVEQDRLLKELAWQDIFQGDEDSIHFLALLQDETIVSVDSHPSSHGGQTLWQLNTAHWAVVNFNADRYLPLFVLGLDHAMARTGYPVIHEHTLQSRLKFYMENNAAEAAYHLALNKGWAKREKAKEQEKQRYANTQFINVELMTDLETVQNILLSRDILLSELRAATPAGGLQRDALKRRLSEIPRFKLKLNEVDDWLTAFQRDSLLSIEKDRDSTDIGRDCIRLNLDTPLVQSLFGRMYACSVIVAMRKLQATQGAGKPANEIIEMLTRQVTRGNKQLATWALGYAKNIKLVVPPRSNAPGAALDLVTLNNHRVVQKLDQRDLAACQKLAELVSMLSRQSRFRDGWVPQPVLIQEMEKHSHLFGYMHSEHEFWINQAVYRKKLAIDIRRVEKRPVQIFLRVVA